MPAGDWIEIATEQIAREALGAICAPDDIYDSEILAVIDAIGPTVRKVAEVAEAEAREAFSAAAPIAMPRAEFSARA